MTTNTATATKKPAVKKTPAKRVATPKKTTTPVKKTTPTKKAAPAKTTKPAVKKTSTRITKSDAELKALAERLWAQGVTSGPHAMSKATRGTADFVLSRRFIKIAQEVIDSHGGKVTAARERKLSAKRTGSLDTLTLMKQEHAALKAWKASGMKGDSPATPTLDKRNAEIKAKSDATKSALATKKAVASVKKSATKKSA